MRNSAEDQGGALYLKNVNFEVCGSIYFGNNVASYGGGALHMDNSKAKVDDKCLTYNAAVMLFHDSVTFNHLKSSATQWWSTVF